MSKPSLLLKCFIIGLLSAAAFYAPPSSADGQAARNNSPAAESLPDRAASSETGAQENEAGVSADKDAQTEENAADSAEESPPANEAGLPGANDAADAESGGRDNEKQAQPTEEERTVSAEEIDPKLVWESSFPGPIAWLSCANDTVAAASEFNSAACAYNLNSGSLLWLKKLPIVAANAPICADNLIIFLQKNGSLSAYIAASGELKYDFLPFPYEKKPQEKEEDPAETADRRQRAIQKAKAKAEERRLYHLTIKDKFSSRKQIAHGSAVCCGPYVACASDSGLLTVGKDNGKKLNWYRLPFSGALFRGIVSTPAAVKYEQNYYMYTVSADGQLCTVNLDEPDEAEVQTVGGSKYEFRLPVAVRGFNLYLTSTDGTVFCFDIKALRLNDQYSDFTPKPVWQWSTHSGRTYQTDSQHDFINKLCFDAPGKRLFVISDGGLHALSATFGKPLWTYARADFKPVCPPVYWRGHIITADEKSRLRFFNAETGAPEKTFSLPELPTTELLVADDKLLMGIKGRILCWNLIRNEIF